MHERIAVEDDGDGFVRRPAAAGQGDCAARGVVGQIAGDGRNRLGAGVNRELIGTRPGVPDQSGQQESGNEQDQPQ